MFLFARRRGCLVGTLTYHCDGRTVSVGGSAARLIDERAVVLLEHFRVLVDDGDGQQDAGA